MPRMLYRSYAQTAWPSMTITVKTAGEPLSLATAAQRAVRKLDADMPVSRVRSMESVITDSMGNRRFPMQLLGLFSLVALTLATIGVYGVVSYLVAQRTRELGIRVALGARRRQVIGLVVVRSLLPIGLGLAVGIAGALVASRLLGTLLYEVKANDPAVLAGIVAMLGGAALFASFIPARRAAAVDPIVVLRHD
jgi:putative ABC transport system permease protein